jgi:predicted hotdog family 3-hydroxylacyl-ACP dehydratase
MDFRRLIPHRGSMSLLEAVLRVDAESITCRAQSHRDPLNPLREGGVLPAICGIEYAAQAMAVHGALTERLGPRPGMLAAARDVVLSVQRLDDIPEDLLLTARRLVGESSRILYGFELRAGERELVRGRVAVALGPRAPALPRVPA